MNALPEPALDLWRFSAHDDVTVRVAPDGCRDLIVVVPRRGAPASFVSALADGIETPAFSAGDHAVGVRLRPGAVIDEPALRLLLRGGERADDADLLAAVGACVRLDERVRAVLECLEEAPALALARRRLGVSERSLERLLAAGTQRGPLWWRNLARARRCARALVGASVDAGPGACAGTGLGAGAGAGIGPGSGVGARSVADAGAGARIGELPGASLAHLADVHGYADQAHMARDLRRWFGASPRRLRADARFIEGLAAPAYG